MVSLLPESMPRGLKRFAAAFLFLAAVWSGTATVYLNSIRQVGEWLHWVVAMVVLTVLLLAALPVMIRGWGGVWALLLAASAVPGVWFGLLNNCHLSGAIRVEQTLASPDGRWVAIRFSSNCTALARACPGTSNVSLLRTGERLVERHGNVIEIPEGGSIIDLRWKGADRLAFDYLGKPTRIREHWAGITIESLQMMWM